MSVIAKLVTEQLQPMVTFEVPDMYPCRSMGAIGKSIKLLDFEATVVVDIVHHRVDVVSRTADEASLSRAIGMGKAPVESTMPGPHQKSHAWLPRRNDLVH